MQLGRTEGFTAEAVNEEAGKVEAKVEPDIPVENGVWDSGVRLGANDVLDGVGENNSPFVLQG